MRNLSLGGGRNRLWLYNCSWAKSVLELLLRKSRLIFAPRFLAGEQLRVARGGVRPQCRAPFLRRRLPGPGRYCSPSHRVPSISRSEGSNHLLKGVLMMRRAMSGRPCLVQRAVGAVLGAHAPGVRTLGPAGHRSPRHRHALRIISYGVT